MNAQESFEFITQHVKELRNFGDFVCVIVLDKFQSERAISARGEDAMNRALQAAKEFLDETQHVLIRTALPVQPVKTVEVAE